jgi:hypothetical protein
MLVVLASAANAPNEEEDDEEEEYDEMAALLTRPTTPPSTAIRRIGSDAAKDDAKQVVANEYRLMLLVGGHLLIEVSPTLLLARWISCFLDMSTNLVDFPLQMLL